MRKRLRFEQRLGLLAFLTALPGTATALYLLWTGPHQATTRWTVSIVVLASATLIGATLLGATLLTPLLERIAAIETRVPVRLESGPALTVHADPDQLEQLLINLQRNAADAVLESSPTASPDAPAIQLSWKQTDADAEILLLDRGPGIANPTNLFVPFFTTKPSGSGIGLTLCRQIAEAHGGSLALENRPDAPGCCARLRLPLHTGGSGG